MTITVRSELDERLSLRPGVFCGTDGDRLMLFRRLPWPRGQQFGAPTAAKRAVLARLAAAPSSMTGDFVDALHAGGWLVTTMRHAGRDLYSLQPVDSWTGAASTDGPPATGELTLSRFTILRREDGDLVVESPLARARMLVHDPAVSAVVTALAHGDDPGTLPPAVRVVILRDLLRAGLAAPRDAAEAPDLRRWSPADLWLHRRSRMGGGGYGGAGYGRTGWATPYLETPAPPVAGPVVSLYRPDLQSLRRSDTTLTAALEDRQSVRAHDDDAPITIGQLGELLYRCAGHRDRGGHPTRPYPAGGGAYELELYPVVRNVRGLAAGMYHYEARRHELRLVREAGPQTGRLLRGAAWSSMNSGRPQVLIVAAARFGRLTSKYEEVAYALVLKHVGVLFQSMYLVATAMGLAGCALGAGDAMAFVDATGLDYTAESSVGEFMLGSRAADGS